MEKFNIEGILLTKYEDQNTGLVYYFDDFGEEYEPIPTQSGVNGMGFPWGAIIGGVTTLIPNLFKKKDKSSDTSSTPTPTNLQPVQQQLVPIVIEKPGADPKPTNSMNWGTIALYGGVGIAGVLFIKSMMGSNSPQPAPYYYPPQGQLRGAGSKNKPKKLSMRVK